MGCRKFKGEAFFDDLTGETHLPEELERIVFVVDGRALEIDLTDEHAEEFRAALAPYVAAARPTSKARVLATLPKKQRHLKAVPASEPEEAPQDVPVSHKGEESEPLSEPEGTRVSEALPDVSDSSSGEESQAPEKMPDEWTPYEPHHDDDQQTRVAKTRAWASLMGTPPEQPLNKMIFRAWEEFYRRQGWRNLE